jgi:two-component system LytT family response regulator
MKNEQQPNHQSWRAIIADDEPRSRAVARRMLVAYPSFNVVAECANGYEVLAAIRQFQPHLLLLDIQMPEMDGFAVLKQINREQMPVVVFATAFDQYAIRAFEVHALDYLIKPFDEQRFAAMMQRVHERLDEGDERTYTQQVLTMLQVLTKATAYPERLVVRLRGKMIPLPVSQIDWIEAEDNYIRIHSGHKSYLDRETLSGICDCLDPRKFIRVHRSAVVNVDNIQELTGADGQYELILKSGARLALSRTYRDEFFLKLGDRRLSSQEPKKS